MASIKVHQDLFGFERKRGGFTTRQRTGLAAAAVAAVASSALFGYLLELPWTVAGTLSLLAGAAAAIPGFVPWWGMPMEEAVGRASVLAKRGLLVPLELEGPDFDMEKEGRTSREHQRRISKRGCERDLGV